MFTLTQAPPTLVRGHARGDPDLSTGLVVVELHRVDQHRPQVLRRRQAFVCPGRQILGRQGGSRKGVAVGKLGHRHKDCFKQKGFRCTPQKIKDNKRQGVEVPPEAADTVGTAVGWSLKRKPGHGRSGREQAAHQVPRPGQLGHALAEALHGSAKGRLPGVAFGPVARHANLGQKKHGRQPRGGGGRRTQQDTNPSDVSGGTPERTVLAGTCRESRNNNKKSPRWRSGVGSMMVAPHHAKGWQSAGRLCVCEPECPLGSPSVCLLTSTHRKFVCLSEPMSSCRCAGCSWRHRALLNGRTAQQPDGGDPQMLNRVEMGLISSRKHLLSPMVGSHSVCAKIVGKNVNVLEWIRSTPEAFLQACK